MNNQPIPDQLQIPVFVMPLQVQTLALYGFSAAAIIALVIAIAVSRKQGNWKPLLCVLGGGACFLYEPLLARSTHVAHSQLGANIALQANMVIVPWHIMVSYVPYFALVFLTIVPLFHKRTLSIRGVYITAAIIAAGVWCFESPWIYLGLWHYYGRQWVRPFGLMPIWAAVGTSMLTYVSALFIARVQDQLSGLRSLLLIPGVVSVSFGAAAAVCWPMWLAMSSGWPGWCIDIAAISVFGLAAMAVYLTAPLAARPIPQT